MCSTGANNWADDVAHPGDEEAGSWFHSFPETFTPSSGCGQQMYPLCPSPVYQLGRPQPARGPLRESHYDQNEGETVEISLEKALEEMARQGELEQFLIDTTISLKHIHSGAEAYCDTSSLISMNAFEASDPLQKPRQRRHSIGTAAEMIRCPFPGCSKVFNRSFNLKSHFKTHSGEKPYICLHCDQCFARNHDLKRHLKTHSCDKPFKCQRCDKTFSRMDALNRHIRLNSCIPTVYSGLC